jgi:hypothetical protein
VSELTGIKLATDNQHNESQAETAFDPLAFAGQLLPLLPKPKGTSKKRKRGQIYFRPAKA